MPNMAITAQRGRLMYESLDGTLARVMKHRSTLRVGVLLENEINANELDFDK